MQCFLCPAIRKDAVALADHFVFWHSAPKELAIRVAFELAGENPPQQPELERRTRQTWVQTRLPGT